MNYYRQSIDKRLACTNQFMNIYQLMFISKCKIKNVFRIGYVAFSKWAASGSQVSREKT